MVKTDYPLDVVSVSKSFKQKHVLDDVSITVEKGEIVGLIGLNGVGKTTLIKHMLNLLPVDHGHISFFGKDIKYPESRQHISYLPEKFQPSNFFKGKEFLKLSQSFYGNRYDEQEAEALATSLGLDVAALTKQVNKYSKGMAQKLGLLSTLLSKAKLLILDEPMSGLDPMARIALKDQLLAYKQAGNSIFFSSHILADIEEICDRIAVLHNTKLIFTGTPKAFEEAYPAQNLERSFLNAVSELSEA